MSAWTPGRSAWRRPRPRWSTSPSARPARPARSSRKTATAASRRPRSSPRRSSYSGRKWHTWKERAGMAQVLIFAEHAGGDVKKVTLELLTLARRLGEPAAACTGPDAEKGRERRAQYGAGRAVVGEGAQLAEDSRPPKSRA